MPVFFFVRALINSKKNKNQTTMPAHFQRIEREIRQIKKDPACGIEVRIVDDNLSEFYFVSLTVS